MKSIVIVILVVAGEFFETNAGCVSNHPINTDASFPFNLNGKLVYHSYVSYGDGTSQIFLYDFASKTLTQLSKPTWGITDPMNAVFSPDGQWIAFMGIKNNAWNIFFYQLGSSYNPIDVTQSIGLTRNEDPKFTKDGKYVFFKQNGDIMKANLTFINSLPSFTNVINITKTAPAIESSMPFPSPDGTKIYFATGTRPLSLYQVTLATRAKVAFDAPQNLTAYYPIVRGDGMVFYSRWKSTTSDNDQICTKVNPSDPLNQLSINDCDSNNSDPAPIDNTTLVFFSSTQPGVYSLYVGDIATGRRWSLDQFGVNSDTTKNKLGASYFGGTLGPIPSLLSQGRPATASTSFDSSTTADKAFDGDFNTRWDSIEGDGVGTQWLKVDLGAIKTIKGVDLYWDAGAKVYEIQVSNNNVNWSTIYANSNGRSWGHESLAGLSSSGRYVRMYGTERATEWGYSLQEMHVYGY